MTSTPASRSTRATTLAPRSCPSRPGLAMTTRMAPMDSSKRKCGEPACHHAPRRTRTVHHGTEWPSPRPGLAAEHADGRGRRVPDGGVDRCVVAPGLAGPRENGSGVARAVRVLDDADLVADDADQAAALGGDARRWREAGGQPVLGQLQAHELADPAARWRRPRPGRPRSGAAGSPCPVAWSWWCALAPARQRPSAGAA